MDGLNYKTDIFDKCWKSDELIAVVNSLPDIRNDRIRSVRDAIASGTYRINPEKIAGRILEEGF